MPQPSKTSPDGIAFIKLQEGFLSEAVPDGAGGWVVGYGHTSGAKEGVGVSREDAALVLERYDLPRIEAALRRHVHAPLLQNEFDALASFVFNIGIENFIGSRVLGQLLAGNRLKAARHMSDWTLSEVAGQLQTVDALIRRRAAESALFLRHPSGFASSTKGLLKPGDGTVPAPHSAARPVDPDLFDEEAANSRKPDEAARSVGARLRDLLRERRDGGEAEESDPDNADGRANLFLVPGDGHEDGGPDAPTDQDNRDERRKRGSVDRRPAAPAAIAAVATARAMEEAPDPVAEAARLRPRTRTASAQQDEAETEDFASGHQADLDEDEDEAPAIGAQSLRRIVVKQPLKPLELPEPEEGVEPFPAEGDPFSVRHAEMDSAANGSAARLEPKIIIDGALEDDTSLFGANDSVPLVNEDAEAVPAELPTAQSGPLSLILYGVLVCLGAALSAWGVERVGAALAGGEETAALASSDAFRAAVFVLGFGVVLTLAMGYYLARALRFGD